MAKKEWRRGGQEHQKTWLKLPKKIAPVAVQETAPNLVVVMKEGEPPLFAEADLPGELIELPLEAFNSLLEALGYEDLTRVSIEEVVVSEGQPESFSVSLIPVEEPSSEFTIHETENVEPAVQADENAPNTSSQPPDQSEESSDATTSHPESPALCQSLEIPAPELAIDETPEVLESGTLPLRKKRRERHPAVEAKADSTPPDLQEKESDLLGLS